MSRSLLNAVSGGSGDGSYATSFLLPMASRETANTCAPDVLTKVALLELGDLLIDLPPSPHLAAFSSSFPQEASAA
jgi:hypothetical protein